MKTLTKETKSLIAKIMAGVMLFTAILGVPGLASAAERVLSNWGSITITRDVSADVYLSSVFSLGGNNFVGFVQDPISWQTYFATSDDAVNWELQSEFFTLVYGRGRFVGVNQNGLHFTDNGTNWRRANLPANITPYSVKFENGTFKLYYRLGDESGLMLSNDAEVWFDITNDVPSNVSTRHVFALGDSRTIALGGTRSGATGTTVFFTTEINENATRWESIESLDRPGFGFFGNVMFGGGSLALHLYDMQTYTSDWTRDTSRDVYVITRDFINWEEKTWEEWNWQPDTTNPNTWYADWWRETGGFFVTWVQTSTEPTPIFNVDGNRFRSLEVLPFTPAGVPFPHTPVAEPHWDTPWDAPEWQEYWNFSSEMRRAFSAGEFHWQTIVTHSRDGTTWNRAAAVISLNGRQLNRSISVIPDADGPPATPAGPDLSTASEWAHEGITRAIAAGLVPQNLQSNYNQATTRAEFAALGVALYEAATGRTITGRASFYDTNDINVQKMGYLGVVTGVGSGNFNPGGQLTREQAAVMLSRLAEVIGQPLAPSAPTFADNASVSSWAFDAVGQMQASGIMGGTGNNNFSPGGDYTREQSIITILRLFDMLE